jgi:outer membrane protein TolC
MGLSRIHWSLVAALLLALPACEAIRRTTDRDVAAAIADRQRQALSYGAPAPVDDPSLPDPRAGRETRLRVPSPSTTDVPDDFRGVPAAASAPASGAASDIASEPATATRPTRMRDQIFTLTDSLRYAMGHRREFITAREDLYLVSLRLLLERHLWTPQFAAELRTVYGNFGEATDFDQAMRFVADLGVSQRLPFGGEFTAGAIGTLIRDVKKSITAAEGSDIVLGLNVPLLRGAGHVAREVLIQLERDLTYAVRDYERFRRRQLVDVASAYFDLLRSKQAVLDAESSVERARVDYERAAAVETSGAIGEDVTPLDTRRAQQRLLSEINRAEQNREQFRFETDQFKLLIGMPVDEPIGMDDLESISDIERQIAEGRYPLLQMPPAASNVERAVQFAVERRYDVLNTKDQIDDAKRAVANAKNAMLPNLDWISTLSFDTDPNHYNMGAHEWERANWRSEMILAMDDRMTERTQYRSARVELRRRERDHTERVERVRVEVRRAVNQIRLQERLVAIQSENLEVAQLRSEFAQIQYEDGKIGNRDVVEAETELASALDDLNAAKTARWSALLEFRAATETLQIDAEIEAGIPIEGVAPDEESSSN